MLQIHRNTVTLHLTGKVAYPPELVLRLGLTGRAPSLAPGQPMSIYEAASLLPGYPAKYKLHRMVRAGILKAENVRGRLYTTLEAVRACAAADLEPGLYFRGSSLCVYASDPELLLASLARKRVPNTSRSSWSKHRGCYPAPVTVAVAEALDVKLSVPSYRVSIACSVLDAVGVCVL